MQNEAILATINPYNEKYIIPVYQSTRIEKSIEQKLAF